MELLERGALANAEDIRGQTPLHQAALGNHNYKSFSSVVRYVQQLLERGADVNAQNKDSETPLHLASRLRLLEMARVLLENSAQVNVKNSEGKSPLQLASGRKRKAMRRLLSEYSAKRPSAPYIMRLAEDASVGRSQEAKRLAKTERTMLEDGEDCSRDKRRANSRKREAKYRLYALTIHERKGAKRVRRLSPLWPKDVSHTSSLELQRQYESLGRGGKAFSDSGDKPFAPFTVQLVPVWRGARWEGQEVAYAVVSHWQSGSGLPDLTLVEREDSDIVVGEVGPRALKEYTKRTGKELITHPLAEEITSCDSPEAILAMLQGKANELNQSQSSDERLTKWLTPTVNVLNALSATLGEGVGTVFPPTKMIFSGISIFLVAARDTAASRDALIELFDRLEDFFVRLQTYAEVPQTTEMTNVMGKILAETLSMLAIATKEMKQRPIKTFLKRVVGRNDIGDALQRLDMLEQGELRMVTAQMSKTTSDLKHGA
ncbi:hypothetical protein EDB86DRAFT_3242664 [Lactarius hatsudake]|nr:hypothetical protein EDB86DRAFT_3242664 [Lactarius hatsudake]